jgi:hypothetical protein
MVRMPEGAWLATAVGAGASESRRGERVPVTANPSRFGALSALLRGWWVLGGCLLLVLALRAPYLSAPLGRDEAGITYVANHWSVGRGSFLYGPYWLDRPPLLVGLFKLAGLGGDRGLRVLGALAAIVLVVAIVLLARAVAGPRAGWIAGLLAAFLAGSASLGAVYTPGELLASVPSTLSVLCLVHAHRSRRARFVLAAGALAVAAALIKQSFLDAGFAGVVFVAVSAGLDRDVRLRWPLAYVAGAAIPLAALLVWLAVAGLSLGSFVYALFGFRLDLLHTLATTNLPLHVRLAHLRHPAWSSGLLLALAGAVLGLWHLRRDRVLAVTFAAWMAAATVGVLGGGSYFMHYLIELVPVSCVAAAALVAGARLPIRLVALGVFVVVALNGAYDGAKTAAHHTPHRREFAIGNYIRDHARPGDTSYVMYARANVVYYTGLRQPYPYLWSLMVRVRPGARVQLQRLLASNQRPTWLVRWQRPRLWRLDPDGTTKRLLRSGYRRTAIVCGFPIYLRRDRPAPRHVTVGACPSNPRR